MDAFLKAVTTVNSAINNVVWNYGVFLLISAGILTTLFTKVFQISYLKHWWTNTICTVFKKDSKSTKNTDKKAISQWQSLCTALAATIGTGNIAGVAAAICLGGPGAVFWMWVAAFLGMMTNYSENILGIYFRRRNKDGEWSGGAMYYLRDGLGAKKGMKTVSKVLAVLFAIFAILASFGIGNMGQVNKITLNMESAFFENVSLGEIGGVSVINLLIGVALMIIGALIILGGLQRIATFAERVVPFMAVVYFIGALVIFFMNIDKVVDMFASIFKFAFGGQAVAGGAIGVVIQQGCKRGVFSNEAGLGSSVMVHSSSNVKEPVRQGMWGIFEVFFDTMIACTMSAVVCLSSGYIDLETGAVADGISDATLVSQTFGVAFGKLFGSAGAYIGESFVAIAMLLFAFTTVLGWSQYGSKAVEYLFGVKGVKIYKVIFVLMIVSGAVMESSIAWEISDTFNGLMMVPNLIAVVALIPLVMKLTQNYVDRKIKGKDVAPMLSYDALIQKEMEARADD